MKTLSFIRKDFLLAKRFVLIIMGLVIVLPLYVSMSLPEIAGMTSFLFTTIFSEMILLQYIAMTELKYPKVETLLCSTPYSRRNIVCAKYLFFLLIFGYCFVVYWIMSLFLPVQIPFSAEAILVTLLIMSIVFGIHTPIQFKFGVENTKYAFMIVLFGISFGAPIVVGWVSTIDVPMLANIPIPAFRLGAVLGSALVLTASAWASIAIYSKREL